MGPWRDFLDNQQSAPLAGGSSSHPGPLSLNSRPGINPLAALRTRPLRSILLSILAIVSLTFLFAALGGPGNEQLKVAYRQSIDRFGKGQASWSPSWDDTEVIQWQGASPEAAGLIDPEWSRDPRSGLLYPPDVNPARMNAYKRANATFVALVRNEEQGSMMSSMRGIEDRFNRKFGYPWVFLNDRPFSEDFKTAVRSMTRSPTYFGIIPKEHWSYPADIDQEKAAVERQKMVDDQVIYGGSESYRMMCRFNSGFFYRHPLMQQFNWYWRVEPGVEYYCDIDYDPFLFMEHNNKTYGFVIAIYEYRRTIETLWDTVREFAQLHPDYIAPHNSLNFLVDDASQGLNAEYNLCHFWSNFEIGDMRFWRSKEYSEFFDYLDSKGGFFYERWGDAPVHSIAAALLLPSSRLHQFDDIAYRHNPYVHCPAASRFHDGGKCFCNPKDSFDLDGYSCMRQWWRVGKKPS